ncbi:MAG: M42 family metallopeptidase, partial [Euryarchaeota archaeon]|nr:M42 family metallopeptidase [Euryarchaeota archaeon]
MKNLLKELVQASGISGFEDDVRSIMARELKPYVNEIIVDNLGNLIAKKQGVKGRPVIMLSAHIDTIGLLVKYVDKKGFTKFAKVGGIVNQTLLGQRVVVHAKSGNYPGVIFSPFEFLPQEKKKEQPEIEEMFIDIGCVNEEDAKQIGVQVGSPISLDRELADLNEDFIVGKAFDDRLGCLALIEIIKQLDPIDATIYAVGNVQEEIGLRGATVSAFKLNPDLAIIIDTTTAADFPSLDAYGYAKLGAGPAIRIADGSRGSLSDGAFMPARLRDL